MRSMPNAWISRGTDSKFVSAVLSVAAKQPANISALEADINCMTT